LLFNRKQIIVVSSKFPQFPYEPDPASETPYKDYSPEEPGPTTREWMISMVLFFLTVITTTFAGLSYAIGDVGLSKAALLLFIKPSIFLLGVSFSFPLLSILLAHEFGHFFACKYYGMRCTPPYFIPMPIPFTGTLGAFIKIKSGFQNKRALFDVGIAGPIAGFLFSLPVLWIGISLSKLIHKIPSSHHALSFGEPLIFRIIGILAIGYNPQKQDMLPHPMAMAGWVGLLATSLNLFPIWQLDGGHISYAIFGKVWHKRISVVMVSLLMLLSLWGWPTPSYLLFGLLLLIIGLRMKFYHPAPMTELEPLGWGRIILGIFALLILILSFTPVPISIS
jgi:membrane-associated protease RseP (regulator of RpoE activity)